MTRWNVHAPAYRAQSPMTTEAIVAEVLAGRLPTDTAVAPADGERWCPINGQADFILALLAAQSHGSPSSPSPSEVSEVRAVRAASAAQEVAAIALVDRNGPPRWSTIRPPAFTGALDAVPPRVASSPSLPEIEAASGALLGASLCHGMTAAFWALVSALAILHASSGGASWVLALPPLLCAARTWAVVGLLRRGGSGLRRAIPSNVAGMIAAAVMLVLGGSVYAFVLLLEATAALLTHRARRAA